MKLGYLVSQYPALSHTFILREVLALRRQGVDVCVVSVSACDRPLAALSADEVAWVDAYHARVAAELAPLVDTETAAWLARATAPIG